MVVEYDTINDEKEEGWGSVGTMVVFVIQHHEKWKIRLEGESL